MAKKTDRHDIVRDARGLWLMKASDPRFGQMTPTVAEYVSVARGALAKGYFVASNGNGRRVRLYLATTGARFEIYDDWSAVELAAAYVPLDWATARAAMMAKLLAARGGK